MATIPGPVTIGWKEYVDFPDWRLKHVRAKVDTGACTSALDVLGYEVVEVPGVGLVARMRIALYRRRPERMHDIEVPVVRMVVVRNSGGYREQRPVIEAVVQIGPVIKRIEVTLTRRLEMRFPMLLGRQALAESFVVDAGHTYLLRR
jgi:hypothetical protein